jgi:hypothetical protein
MLFNVYYENEKFVTVNREGFWPTFEDNTTGLGLYLVSKTELSATFDIILSRDYDMGVWPKDNSHLKAILAKYPKTEFDGERLIVTIKDAEALGLL